MDLLFELLDFTFLDPANTVPWNFTGVGNHDIGRLALGDFAEEGRE